MNTELWAGLMQAIALVLALLLLLGFVGHAVTVLAVCVLLLTLT